MRIAWERYIWYSSKPAVSWRASGCPARCLNQNCWNLLPTPGIRLWKPAHKWSMSLLAGLAYDAFNLPLHPQTWMKTWRHSDFSILLLHMRRNLGCGTGDIQSLGRRFLSHKPYELPQGICSIGHALPLHHRSASNARSTCSMSSCERGSLSTTVPACPSMECPELLWYLFNCTLFRSTCQRSASNARSAFSISSCETGSPWGHSALPCLPVPLWNIL